MNTTNDKTLKLVRLCKDVVTSVMAVDEFDKEDLNLMERTFNKAIADIRRQHQRLSEAEVYRVVDRELILIQIETVSITLDAINKRFKETHAPIHN